LFIVEDHKATVDDAADNFSNLYILGMVSPNIRKKCILQVDMSLNSYILKTMDDSSDVPYSPDYLNNIIFNNALFDVLSSGSVDGNSYLVETFDLFASNCDTEISLLTPAISYNAGTLSDAVNVTYNFGSAATNAVDNYSLNSATACSDMQSASRTAERKAEIQRMIDKNKARKQGLNSISKIEIYKDNFVCKEFVGNCNYKIFDVLGRAIQQGNTQNGVVNNINISTAGIYTISVTDEKNNTLSNKVVVNK
jgi:hypothetical protein